MVNDTDSHVKSKKVDVLWRLIHVASSVTIVVFPLLLGIVVFQVRVNN